MISRKSYDFFLLRAIFNQQFYRFAIVNINIHIHIQSCNIERQTSFHCWWIVLWIYVYFQIYTDVKYNWISTLINRLPLFRLRFIVPVILYNIIKYRFNMGVLSIHNLRSFISKYKVAMMVVVAGFASNMVVKGLMKSVGEL